MVIIPPHQIRQVWPAIAVPIRDIEQRCPESWIAEDVYCELREGRSWLLLSDDNLTGCVFSQRQCHWSGKPFIWVWCGWNHADKSRLSLAWELLQTIAKQGDATRIEFSSARKGMARLAGQFGFVEGLKEFYWEVF